MVTITLLVSFGAFLAKFAEHGGVIAGISSKFLVGHFEHLVQ
jgi:hypothetical protein